jgi:hypothetical protein
MPLPPEGVDPNNVVGTKPVHTDWLEPAVLDVITGFTVI